MKKATLQIFPEWEETGNVAAWNRIVFFSQRNLHGTPLKEQSTCLCHFSCTRLQFNAIFHILQMVSEMFCSALNEPREGTRAVKSDFCPHVIPRTSRDAALLGHSSGGLLLQQLRLSTWGGCFLLFGSLKKNWPVGAVGRQRHFTEMGLNETSTVGTALQVPFIIIWQVLGVLVPWRFVSSPEIPTCHWKPNFSGAGIRYSLGAHGGLSTWSKRLFFVATGTHLFLLVSRHFCHRQHGNLQRERWHRHATMAHLLDLCLLVAAAHMLQWSTMYILYRYIWIVYTYTTIFIYTIIYIYTYAAYMLFLKAIVIRSAGNKRNQLTTSMWLNK